VETAEGDGDVVHLEEAADVRDVAVTRGAPGGMMMLESERARIARRRGDNVPDFAEMPKRPWGRIRSIHDDEGEGVDDHGDSRRDRF